VPAAEGFPGGALARGPIHSSGSGVSIGYLCPIASLSESDRNPIRILSPHRKTVAQGLCSGGIQHNGASTMAVAGVMAFLAEVGAERDQEQQTKTRRSLMGQEAEGQT